MKPGLLWHVGAMCLRKVVLLLRDTDEGDEGTPWQEQANWETEQIKKASMKTGAKDSQAKAKDYDFVFEDQIDFITDQAMAGTLVSHLPLISLLLNRHAWDWQDPIFMPTQSKVQAFVEDKAVFHAH